KFVSILSKNYSWVVGILALSGFIFAWLKSRKLFIFLFSLAIFYSYILSAVIGLVDREKLPLDLFTEQPFYIPLVLLSVFLAGLGVKFLFDIFLKNKNFSVKI